MRTIAIQIDCGETECGECEQMVFEPHGGVLAAVCRAFGRELGLGPQHTRLPACLAAERGTCGTCANAERFDTVEKNVRRCTKWCAWVDEDHYCADWRKRT